MKNEYRSVFNNAFFLTVLQLLNYAFPLLLMPLLISRIGLEKYGAFAFVLTVANTLCVFVDYGFNFTATSLIARRRKNLKYVDIVFQSVILSKALIASSLIVLVAVFTIFITKFQENKILHIYSFLHVLGFVLFPVWYFQGIEKMKYITFFQIGAKLISLVLVFVFVQTKDDCDLAVFLFSLGTFAGGLLAFMNALLMLRPKKILLSRKAIKKLILKSFHVFLSRLFVASYTNINIIVTGLVASNAITGVFYAVDQIVRSVPLVFMPLYRAAFPLMSRKAICQKNEIAKLLKRCLFIVAILSVLFSAGLYLKSDMVFLLFNINDNVFASQLLNFMVFIPIAVSVSGFMVNLIILPFRMQSSMSQLYAKGMVVNFILLALAISFFEGDGVMVVFSIAIVAVFVEAFLALMFFKLSRPFLSV